MKKILTINLYVLTAFVLMASLIIPQGKVSAAASIHLHIDGGELSDDTKVTLVYEEDDDEEEINMYRHNGTLYKAGKPSGFQATLDVTFEVEEDGKTEAYDPVKVTGKNGTINYWITIDGDDDEEDTDNNDNLTTFVQNKPLTPFVKDVYNNGDGTFTAYWGYKNDNHVKVDAKTSIFTNGYVYNQLTPLKKGFREGRVEEAFKSVFTGASLTWELTGPDGIKRSATALASSAKSYRNIHPLLTGVYKNLDGTYTAYWGYHNENHVTVDSKASQFTTSVLNQAEPMKTNFLPGFVEAAFNTKFNTGTLGWNFIGLNGSSSTVTANISVAQNYGDLLPKVTAVYNNGNGTYTAYWGYQNSSAVSVDALESKFISGTVSDNEQPMSKNFFKGSKDAAFKTVFKGDHLIWQLRGPNGEKRIATAITNNAIPYSALLPLVNKVVSNGDGTYTAVWGYHNLNTVEISSSNSTFKGTVLKNEVALNQFKPGLQNQVFETTFKGTGLTWEVEGPDGVTRTVTAYSKNAITQ
ncbi:hypothetical protein ACFSCX_13160 [Bacillus salitolerans]|uniref:Uncharacterized protein n=1 Tax=Bacillus salitolerans TaxID=1437434 RepID=A0ABW4LTT7_9BACI